MQWGTTAKELEASNFFKEFPKIVKGFRVMYVSLILLIAGMIFLSYGAPWNWQITVIATTWPLAWAMACHIMAPVVLINPQLMTFSFSTSLSVEIF
ncbi:hypothetical protein V1524DRAFT_428621 [Lipomyces starkeyi]